MDPKRLREATRPEHEATEAAVPLMKADLSRAEYVRVLQRFYLLVNAWDRYAAQSAPAAYASLAAARRRSDSLRRDLAYFQQAPEKEASTSLLADIGAIVGHTDAAPYRFLGAMYVVEGSTLGGRFIADHVEKVLGLDPGEGDAFFRGYGEQTSTLWRAFQAEVTAVPGQYGDAVIAAAKGMFALFQKVLPVDTSVAETHAMGADAASY